MSSMCPLVVQAFLFDGLGHYTLVRLIKTEIETVRKNTKTNEYRLFVLYFTLFDIALSEDYEMIDQAIGDITIPILRYMIFLKLNYYLAFKSSRNNRMADFLQERAKQIKMQLNNKTDVDRLQQALSDTKKTSLIGRAK